MLKDEIPGDQFSRHRKYRVALVSRILFLCALLIPFTLIALSGMSSAHSMSSSSAASTPPASGGACNSSWSYVGVETIRSGINGHFVTADLNASGELRTFVDTAGLWEQFGAWQCRNNQNIYAFQSFANGHFVSARLDASGLLMAYASTINTWEEFQVNCDGARVLCAFQSLANGNYVSTRMDDPREPLMAYASTIQSWETFILRSPLP